MVVGFATVIPAQTPGVLSTLCSVLESPSLGCPAGQLYFYLATELVLGF